MATKEENLNRLRQLAGLLGREADMSGSAGLIKITQTMVSS